MIYFKTIPRPGDLVRRVGYYTNQLQRAYNLFQVGIVVEYRSYLNPENSGLRNYFHTVLWSDGVLIPYIQIVGVDRIKFNEPFVASGFSLIT